MPETVVREVRGAVIYGVPLACPEPQCSEILELELAADVALDFMPIGEPYETLVALGGRHVWHCYGCGHVSLAEDDARQ